MSSVTCRKCKANNPAGSKFCNNCGAPLPPSTSQICPSCQTRNAPHLLYCDNCGTRLLPEAGLSFEDERPEVGDSSPSIPRAFSLPTREPGDTGDLNLNQLPEWLRSGVEPVAPPEDEADAILPAADEGQETPKVEDILGDWLSQDLADEPITQKPAGEEEEPDWLRDLQGPANGGPEPGSEDSSAWWEELGASVAEKPAIGAEDTPASWLAELDAGDEGMIDSEPPPDWLSELAAEEPLRTEPAEPPSGDDQPAAAALADWLAELGPVAGSADSQPEEAGVEPDWAESQLSSAGMESADVEEESEPADSYGLPDWLREEIETAEQARAPRLTGDLPPGPEATTDEAGTPEWLREGSGDFGDGAATPAVDEDRVDWIEQVQASEQEDFLPEWLAEIGGRSEPDVPAEPEDRTAPPDDLAAEWEDQADQAGPIPGSGLPAWLRDEVSQATETGQAFPDWEDSEGQATELAETEMPDWLRGEVRDTGALDSGNLPDWLSELGAVAPAADEQPGREDGLLAGPSQEQAFAEGDFEPSDEGAEPERDELADLLREMAPRGTGILTPLEEDSTEEELAAELGELGFDTAPLGEVPDWLAELSDGPEPEIEPVTTVEAADPDQGVFEPMASTPDQEDLALVEAEPVFLESTGGTGELAEDEVPEWLAALAEQDEWPQLTDEESIAESVSGEDEEPLLPQTTPLGPVEPSREMSGVPKELAKPGLPEWLAEESDEPIQPIEPDDLVEEAAPLVAGELPEWLQELDSDQEQAVPISAEEASLTELTSWAEPAAEWQETLDATVPSEQEPAQAGSPAEGLMAAEIPPWLQALRPRDFDATVQEVAADEPVESEGPLAGLRGVIQVGPAVAVRHLASEPRHHMVTKENRQQVALLTQIAQAEPRPTSRPARGRIGPMSVATRTVLGIGLLVVVLLGLLLPALGAQLPILTRPPLLSSAQDVFDQINNAAGETVLVSFEYSPAMAGELEPIATMLLAQLAENGSPVVTMSQYAAGIALADRAVSQIENLESQSLGFVPGEAVGLRRLTSCLSASTACEMMFGQTLSPEMQAGLANVKLAVVLTAERDSLVNWIEQVQAPGEIPVVVGVTQAIAPMVAPYLSAGRLQGAVEGTAAAAAYERELLAEEGQASEQQAALTIVQWAVIILLIGGAIVYGLSALAAGRPRKAGA